MKRRVCAVAASEITVRAFLAGQLRAMQEDYDLTVVVNTTNPELLQELGVGGSLRPVPIQRRISITSDIRSLVRLVRIMRAERFDLVQSMTPKAGLLAMVAAWVARVPVRIHTFTGQVWATRKGLTRFVLKSVDTIVARCATFTLADSPSQRDFLIGQGVVPAAKLAVLGSGSVSGVDAERFRPAPALRCRLRERMGIPASDVVLLFIGRLATDKGVLDLAHAFDILAYRRPDVHLLAVGPDEQQMRPAMRAICSRHPARLHFLEFTKAPEEAMAAADILCLPSYREGFGSVIIEAAAAGLPAVASRIYGVVDAVDDTRTGLLHEPADIDGIVTQLQRLISDPGFRLSLGEAARARARQEFSQHRVLSALLALYDQLLDNGAPARPAVGFDRPPRRAPLATDPGGCSK